MAHPHFDFQKDNRLPVEIISTFTLPKQLSNSYEYFKNSGNTTDERVYD